MALIRTVFTCLFLQIALVIGFAQHYAKLDSLIQITRTHKHDTLGVLAYADLCYEYRFINQDSALLFGNAGVALGKKIKFRTGLAQVYSDAAFIYFDKSDFGNAIQYWSEALKLRSSLNDSARIASLNMKLGGAYFKLGNYELALENQMQALAVYERLNYPPGVAQALNNVAAVYEHQNLLEKAMEYYAKAYDIHLATKNSMQSASTLLNIGNIYFRKKNYGNAKVKYRQSVNMLKPLPNAQHYLSIAYNNLSEIYTLYNEYDSALLYSNKALIVREETGDYQGVVSSMNMIGRIQTKLGRYRDAEKILTGALDSAQRKNLVLDQSRIHENLFELYKSKGELHKALPHLIDHGLLKDSLLNERSRQQVAQLQIKYETEKKEQLLALQDAKLSAAQARIEKSSITIASLIITVVLIAIIFVLARNRQKRKEELIRKENEISVREAYIEASIQSQENERKRFAQDLHDGMGQWLSSLRLAVNEIHGAPDDETKTKVVERTENIMDEMNREFRSIAFNLMPFTLIQYGLKAALVEMATMLNTSGKIFISVSAFEFPERLSELKEISLYRIVQEWTNNILKYSQATKVEIQLIGYDTGLNIMIEDNGKGFDTEVLKLEKGNGWKNIQTRLNLIKGTVELDSSATTNGTTLTLTLPINAPVNTMRVTESASN
jgi:signal transduction histidine kinase